MFRFQISHGIIGMIGAMVGIIIMYVSAQYVLPTADDSQTSISPTRTISKPVDSIASITGKWQLEMIRYPDGTIRTDINNKDTYILFVSEDYHLGIGTDCNSIGGTYTWNSAEHRIYNIETISTSIGCDGSFEGAYMQIFNTIDGFIVTSEHNLLQLTQANGGVAMLYSRLDE